MTINELAALAKVSIGTVDRVIHKRGKVAPETARRVEEAIALSGYRINPLASHLKLHKEYVIGVVLPQPDSEDGYWRYVYDGMQKAEKELQPFSIRLQFSYFDRRREHSCLQAGKQLAGRVDALIVAPLVPSECEELIGEFRDIPYAFIDSALPGFAPAAVFAQDSFQGGFTAGRIMKLLVPHARILATFQLYSSAFNSNERSRGFLSFFSAEPGIQTFEVQCEKTDTDEGLNAFWDDLFERSPDIDGIFVVNDAVHRLGTYLKRRQIKDRVALVGYDLIDQNRRGLLDGSIDALVSQRPEFQGYTAVYELYRTVVLHQNVEASYVPIDIYFKENVPKTSALQ